MTQTEQIAFADIDVPEIVRAVTEAFVHVDASATQPAGAADRGRDEEAWIGCITISGAYNGAITLRCTRTFARQAARSMFGTDTAGISDEAARDALAELTNVVGGNIKSLLSALVGSTCRISLPVVATGQFELPGARLTHEWWCECGAERIAIRIFEAPASTDNGAAGRRPKL